MTSQKSSSEPVELDRIDHAILNILAVDARISMTSLAEKVGLSKTPVLARVRRLEQEGVILNYRATLSPAKLGLSHVVFVETRLLDTREKALKAFNDAVARIPEVEECHMIAGGYDYLLKVRTHDIAEYRMVMAEKISSLPHVSSTSTFVAMEAVKETALPNF